MTNNERIEQRASQIPAAYRRIYLRAVNGEASRSEAIKAMCQACMGWEDMANQIRGCTSPTCPLYPYRPFKHPEEGSLDPQEHAEEAEPTRNTSDVPEHARAPQNAAGSESGGAD